MIITDIRMPKMDGLEFIEALREKKLDIPILIITAFNEIEYLTKAIELKVEKFIQKPIDAKILLDDVKKLAQIIENQRDLERKKSQLENYKRAINLTSYVIDISSNGDILRTSKSLRKYIKEEFKEELIEFLDISQILPQEIEKEMYQKVNKFDIFHRDIVLAIKDKEFNVNLTAFASLFDRDDISVVSLILKDFSHIVKKKDEKIYELYKDIVTKLPNRHALNDFLNKKEKEIALMVISIDEFRKYRHTYGFKIADKILIQVAEELKKYWPHENERVVYKLNEELFAIALYKKSEECKIDDLKEVLDDFINHFDSFVVTLDDLTIDITVTIGVSTMGDTDILLESLIALDAAYLNRAHYKLYEELENPKGAYKKNIFMQQKVKRALDSDRIIPFFQAIVDKDEKVVKYETLARVIDPDNDNKQISPADFLDVVQDSKNYEKFTKTVIKKAMDASIKLDAPISINLSHEDITNPSLIEYLEELLKKDYFHHLTIEFLESEGLEDMEKTQKFCALMKRYGAKIAIDDFGSGYSNYEYFLEIPIDILKIDGSLVKRVNEYKGYALLESIITYAKKLDIEVIAEFVENREIFEILKGLGVDMYQGYYFSKPNSLEDILAKR